MRYQFDPSDTIGVLIAQVRRERGISQLRLAEQLCGASGLHTVTRHEVSRWERQERIPSGFWLGWLALVLELPLAQLEQAAGAARRHRHRQPGIPAHWREYTPGVFTRLAS